MTTSKIIKLSLLLVIFCLAAYQLANYPLFKSELIIHGEKFGDLTAKYYKNSSESLSLIVYDKELENEFSEIETLVLKNGSATIAVSLDQLTRPFYLPGAKIERNCYEIIGELVRLSEIAANQLKFKNYSPPNIIGVGIESSSLTRLASMYAKEKFHRLISNTSTVQDPNYCIIPSNDNSIFHTTNPAHITEESSITVLQYLKENLDFYPHEPLTDNLPIIEHYPKKLNSDYFYIFLSGDGGWATIDKDITKTIVNKGAAVIGFDCLRYFWQKKTPAKFSADLEKLLKSYVKTYGKQKVVLLGFSYGANIIPFAYNNFSNETKDMISKIILLNPTKRTEFEINFSDWIETGETTGTEVAPEIMKIASSSIQNKVSCLYGQEEKDNACTQGLPENVNIIPRKGNHHFDEDYKSLADLVIKISDSN